MAAYAGAALSPVAIDKAVREWLLEDLSSFDVGGDVVGTNVVTAHFLAKSPVVVAGFPFAEAVLKHLGCTVTWKVPEGAFLGDASSKNRVLLGVAEGPANRLLQAERTALEVLTRAGACATYARQCVVAAKAGYGTWRGKVAATRKTTPGTMRLVEKYGAIVGGADPHRYSLSSMVMLKDNHIDVAGSITKAVHHARKLCGFSVKIEVECRTEADAMEACAAGADVVMLDNFTADAAKASGQRVKAAYPHCIVELSGGITAESVGRYAGEGVDIISVGKITHGPPPVDISMKIAKRSML